MSNPNERLIEAAKSGNLVELRAALDAGANVNNKIDGNTSLLWASAKGYIEIVKELINRGADLNIQDGEGFTPLNWASSLGHIDIVKELINRGADINKVNNEGETPLYSACIYKQLDCVRELLMNNANVNLTNNHGNTPLHIAGMQGDLPILQLLFAHGANYNILNNYGASPYDVTMEDIKGIIPPPDTPIDPRKIKIIQDTKNAIISDTSSVIPIDINEKGKDIIGVDTKGVKEFIDEDDNKNNSFIWKIYQDSKSYIYMINKDNLLTVLQNAIVYPCLKANNIPGQTTNVITDLPLYNFTALFNVHVLIKKNILDDILKNNGNIFVVSNKKLIDYITIASHEIVFNSGSLVSGLHCNSGAEPEQLWNIKLVESTSKGDSARSTQFARRGGSIYQHKLQKYENKLNKII